MHICVCGGGVCVCVRAYTLFSFHPMFRKFMQISATILGNVILSSRIIYLPLFHSTKIEPAALSRCSNNPLLHRVQFHTFTVVSFTISFFFFFCFWF